MTWKRRFSGGLLAVVGYILSPLSWWNDAFVNLPLALGLGWLVSWIYQPAFNPAVVAGYWATNVVGLVLMHRGAASLTGNQTKGLYTRRELLIDLAIASGYTALIVVLLKLKVLKPITDYISNA